MGNLRAFPRSRFLRALVSMAFLVPAAMAQDLAELRGLYTFETRATMFIMPGTLISVQNISNIGRDDEHTALPTGNGYILLKNFLANTTSSPLLNASTLGSGSPAWDIPTLVLDLDALKAGYIRPYENGGILTPWSWTQDNVTDVARWFHHFITTNRSYQERSIAPRSAYVSGDRQGALDRLPDALSALKSASENPFVLPDQLESYAQILRITLLEMDEQVKALQQTRPALYHDLDKFKTRYDLLKYRKDDLERLERPANVTEPDSDLRYERLILPETRDFAPPAERLKELQNAIKGAP